MLSVKISHELNFDAEFPEEIRAIAIANGECEETKAETIAEFRALILEKNECQPHRMDDAFLQKFLRARYWNIDASHILIRNYYKFRAQNKIYYEKVRPFDLESIVDDDLMKVTPYYDQHGHRLIIFRFGIWKPSKLPLDDFFRAVIATIEVGSLEPTAQVLGGIVIFDLKDLSFNHVLQLSPSVAQKMIALLVTSMPIRTAALHIVNENWAFNAAFNIFKPLLSATMREKLFLHGSDMESLHKHINPSNLPKRYGGVHDDFPNELWFENLRKDPHVRKEMESLGYVF